MSDDKSGTDPAAVRHLRPTNMPTAGGVTVMPDAPETRPLTDAEEMVYQLIQLKKLREPFPPDRIEKLPKPMWKDAWKNKQGSRCGVCNGYHVLENSIHLDYVGHANTTDRLLEVDPLWSWEPLAFTDQGLPLFDNSGGLWIRLTVCGVTRLGYGDGKEPKEIIGDAIRNAAMRFGVALDLWAKIDLHADRNVGDGETSQRNRSGVDRAHSGERDGVHSSSKRGPGRRGGSAGDNDTPRAPNQDALDSLQSVCDEYGYSTQYCIDRFHSDHDKHIREADADAITAFAAQLIEEATPEPEMADGAGGTAQPDAGRSGGDDKSGEGVLADEAQSEPYDGVAKSVPSDDAPLF